MADIHPVLPAGSKRSARLRAAATVSDTSRRATVAGRRALADAKSAGLLDSETEHLSFRAPKALIAAAKREAGITSTTELGITALALLAQPDPFAEFFKRSEGVLGPDHDLEY